MDVKGGVGGVGGEAGLSDICLGRGWGRGASTRIELKHSYSLWPRPSSSPPSSS